MITLQPIAFVKNIRKTADDDNWGEIISEIILTEKFTEESLKGIDAFSHLEIIYYFDKVNDSEIVAGSRHPRGNKNWPEVGIFAQRGKNRPNKVGATIVKLIEVKNKKLIVQGLDAIDNTPVLDIKPVMAEFLPLEKVRQPDWSHELMKKYW